MGMGASQLLTSMRTLLKGASGMWKLFWYIRVVQDPGNVLLYCSIPVHPVLAKNLRCCTSA